MVAGVRQTFGSVVFEDNIATEDDHATVAIRSAGAVIIGKTACPEFGLPCYTETEIGPPARTPWDLSRSAGGSSGGAGAAVAAGLAPAAHGNDGGGSMSIPASVCGLFGIKPSRGRISNRAAHAGPGRADHRGPAGAHGRRRGAAARRDDREPSRRHVYPAAAARWRELPELRRRDPAGCGSAGRCRTRSATVRAPGLRRGLRGGERLLADLGHDVEDVDMPYGAEVVPAFETLWYAMATLAPVRRPTSTGCGR